tara:strand:- start:193 stop:393 length:201 start_codon:yes stop_codon:yes gene_type:complete
MNKEILAKQTISLVNHLACILEEIQILKERTGPQDCGHLKTTASVLQERAKEIKSEISNIERQINC